MFVLISRVDFLEMENKKLRNKILHMSNQLAVLEHTVQNMQSLHFAEVRGAATSASCLFIAGMQATLRMYSGLSVSQNKLTVII